MGLGRREEEVPLAGVLCEDPPASGSAVVRPPIWEVESYIRRRTPLGQDQASKGPVPYPKRAALKLWV